MNKYYVYIVASKKNGTLYIGMTNDVMRRAFEHREKMVRGFTVQYNVTRLVYFEEYNNVENAIKREKVLKEWRRSWKIRLIEKMNPEWNDLYLFYQDGSRTTTG